jgi:Protein of unknown function (DUF3237)
MKTIAAVQEGGAPMETNLLFEMSAEVAEPIVINSTPDGDRIVVHVTGGQFKGPRIRGRILPSGGDWLLLRPDGIGVVDVRLVLETDDGERIYMVYRGLVNDITGVKEPTKIRTAPTFATSTKGKYAWINAVQAVADGDPTRRPDGGLAAVRYSVYELR